MLIPPCAAPRFYCQGGGGQGSFRDKPCRAAHILRPGKPLPPGQVFDLQLNHLSGNGLLHGTVGEVVAWYRLMLGTTLPPPGAAAGAPPEAWALVTPLRDPVAHYLSWYYYFGEPDSHYTVEQWLNTRMGANGAPRHARRCDVGACVLMARPHGPRPRRRLGGGAGAAE